MLIVLRYIYGVSLEIATFVMLMSVLLWGVLDRLCSRKSFFTFWKVMNICVLVVGCVIIVYSTIIFRTAGTSEIYLMPFYSYFEAQENVEMYRTNLMNVFLFLPFGLSLPIVLSASFKKKVLFTVLAAAGVSVAVELIQFVFELGRVETDDVIHNTLGAALGVVPVVVNRMRVKR